MATAQPQPAHNLPRNAMPHRSNTLMIPSSTGRPTIESTTAKLNRLTMDAFSPVNQNGSYEFDRVIKSGYVQKRTQKTKTWKSIYLVLRPSSLSIYKTEKEDKLRYKLYASDLTAVTVLKDPKQKRENVFGLFSPSKNFHLQAPTAKDAQEWVDLIRKEARIEEEEEEMFMASPVIRRMSYAGAGPIPQSQGNMDRIASSSPEPMPNIPSRRPTMMAEYSGLSGNEVASHSDLSDAEIQRKQGASIESLTARAAGAEQLMGGHCPELGNRNISQASGLNIERDPDRVIYQGWLWFLRSKRGVKQWKNMWAVLRPRNLILYKDESEYTAQCIVPLSSIINVVDIDAVSKSKTHCLQIITDEKRYKLCAHDEEGLVQCLGAFKSLLAKRREFEARAAAANTAAGAVAGPSS